MKKLLVFLVLFLFVQTASQAFTLSSFDNPESMACDPKDGSYYVSNVNGNLTDKKGTGYLSKISASGAIVIQRFIGGTKGTAVLDAPKGLLVAGNTLCVTDIDTVKIFDKRSKKFLVSVDLAPHGAKFLNDIVADKAGALYVSDTRVDRIFKIDPKRNYEVTVFADSPELGGPNGLIFNPKSRNLMVVTWKTGQILEIAHDGKIHTLKKGLSTLDGIDFDKKGNLYVSNFDKGEIYRIPRLGRGTLSTILSGLTSPADLSYSREKEELLVPSLNGGKVWVYDKRSLEAKVLKNRPLKKDA